MALITGLKVQWCMNEASGDILDNADAVAGSGTTYDLDSDQGGSWNDPGTAAGKVSTCRTFTGSGQAKGRADESAFNAYPLSIDFWIKTSTADANDNQRGCISKYTPGSLNGWLAALYRGSINFWYFKDGSNYIYDGAFGGVESGNIADGNWHHIFIVVNASGAEMWVDGSSVDTRAWTGTAGAPTSTAMQIMGTYHTFPNVNSDLDVMRLWWSDKGADVAEAYNSGSGVEIGAASGNVTVTPDPAELTITTFAPTVTVTDNVTVTPAPAALTITTFAPTVSFTEHVTVTPAPAELTITTFAPTVSTTEDVSVTPEPAALTITTFAPTVTITTRITPSPATLTLSTFAPTVTATAHVRVTPSPASLTLTTFAPTVTISTSTGIPDVDYLGRYRRGELLPLLVKFLVLPNEAPTVRFYDGETLTDTIRLPLLSSTLFGAEYFLGTDFDDGQYAALLTWEVGSSQQHTVWYFDVVGGVGREPIISLLEQQRPLGRAVVSIDDAGLARLRYNPKIGS